MSQIIHIVSGSLASNSDEQLDHPTQALDCGTQESVKPSYVSFERRGRFHISKELSAILVCLPLLSTPNWSGDIATCPESKAWVPIRN